MAAIPVKLLEAYSRAEITRREIEDDLGEPVGFARLLRGLRDNGLQLPRIASDPDKVELVRQIVEAAERRKERSAHAG